VAEDCGACTWYILTPSAATPCSMADVLPPISDELKLQEEIGRDISKVKE
jgi:hypothetical protein